MIFGIFSCSTPLLLGIQVSDIGPSWSSCLGYPGLEFRNLVSYVVSFYPYNRNSVSPVEKPPVFGKLLL